MSAAVVFIPIYLPVSSVYTYLYLPQMFIPIYLPVSAESQGAKKINVKQ